METNQKYNVQTAMQEYALLSEKVMQKVEFHLERDNSFEVAKIYSLVQNELYKTDEDARKMKLTGKLVPEMYDVMSNGCIDIGKQIILLSHEYSLGNKVYEIYNVIRSSNKITSTYLAEYMRTDKD